MKFAIYERETGTVWGVGETLAQAQNEAAASLRDDLDDRVTSWGDDEPEFHYERHVVAVRISDRAAEARDGGCATSDDLAEIDGVLRLVRDAVGLESEVALAESRLFELAIVDEGRKAGPYTWALRWKKTRIPVGLAGPLARVQPIRDALNAGRQAIDPETGKVVVIASNGRALLLDPEHPAAGSR